MKTQLLKNFASFEPGGKANVLMVDDDPDIQIALTDLLSHEGYSVTIAETGQAALDLTEYLQFHAVILDLGLPDFDGLDILTQMSTHDRGLPIIILTAYSSLERYLGHQEQNRAFAFLSKPFDRNILKDTLHRAIQFRNPLVTPKKL